MKRENEASLCVCDFAVILNSLALEIAWYFRIEYDSLVDALLSHYSVSDAATAATVASNRHRNAFENLIFILYLLG